MLFETAGFFFCFFGNFCCRCFIYNGTPFAPGPRHLKYDSEVYFRPYSLVFPGIDAFALDSRDDTLYFFQMKYTGAEPIEQGSKVQSFWDAAVASEDVSV